MDWREQVINMAQQAVAGFTPAPTTTVTAQAPFSAGFPSPPNFDPLDALPPGAAERLRLLRQRSADLHAIIPPGEDVRIASNAKVEAANRVRELQNHPQDFGHGLPDTDARVIAAKKHAAKMIADFERLKQLQEVRAAAWQAAAQPLANAEIWLRDGRPHGTVLEDYQNEPPKLNKGESLIDGIDRVRRAGRQIKASINTIQSSCFPRSYCKQRAHEQVEQLAIRGAISVSRLVEHDGDIEFPTMQVTSAVYNVGGGAVAYHEAVDVVGLMAFLHKSALIAALDREIDAEGDDAGSLSHEDRQRRDSEAQGDLL